MAERKETVVLEFEADTGASIESIESLTKANKTLREERNKLNLQSADGQKRAKEINALLDQNTTKIKTNVSALEQQKINIGNYKSALDGVHPALGKVGQGLEAGASGFKAMAKSALSFIATPIGAVLAGLVVAFTLIKTAIGANNEVLDKFENITNAIGTVVTVVTNRIGKLGEALIAFVSLDFDKAVELTGEAFGGLADEIGRAVGESQVLLEMSRDLEDAQRQLRIEQAKQENVIKALVVSAKNRNLSLDQQEGKLKEALRLESNLVATREKLALQELEIAARTIANEEGIQKAASENFQQFAERLVKNGQLGDDQVDGLIDQIEKLEQARGSSLAFQEKVENSLAAVQEKRALALEKQNAALAEQAILDKAHQRALSRQDSSKDPLIDAFETRAKVITNIDERLKSDTEERDKDSTESQADREKWLTQQKADQARARLETLSASTDAAKNIFGEESAAYKVLASAQTLISTYSAAQKAFDSLVGIPYVGPALGAAAAALAIASGLANVAAINGVEFAEGGWTGPGSKMKAVGVVHADEYVAPKWIVNNPMAQPHLAALEGMRTRGYADGGLVTNSISQPINQQFELSNILKNMPAGEVSVVEINRTNRRVRVKEALSKR